MLVEEFEELGQKVVLKGVSNVLCPPREISFDQLSKWSVGNDIWAVAVVEVLLPDSPAPELPEVQKLLQTFQDVFQQPTELPPPRFYEHHIPLLPGSTPVNARPY